MEFIHSDLAIDDQFCINALIKAYKDEDASDVTMYGFSAANEFLSFVDSLSFPNPTNAQQVIFSVDQYKEFFAHLKKLGEERLNSKKSELEVMLFRDILGISVGTLEYLASLDLKNRTYADGYANRWNQEIEQKLNLSHYWRQDDSFKLRINYKQGVLFFEITDRTGATYTFKERSSGLRYFLSYYIQAKAIENTSDEKGAIILMDEPDSFLSIMGQRNLLSIFESLVRPESSNQQCQLVYTTHSPFLINRNFPARLRLVRKGDVEEGTQVISNAMLRRYEPVRSALGIDCAQTLFMGATNVVVEGPSDQLILCELIRYFACQGTVSDFLDLNSVVVLSAESASSVEKLLSASQWGDEPVPATVVLLDSDAAGNEAKKRITGKARKSKKLIDEDFALSIGEVFNEVKSPQIFTTEDMIPAEIFLQAVKNHFEKWMPEEYVAFASEFSALPSKCEARTSSIVDIINELMEKVSGGKKKCYDKFGVFQEVITLLEGGSVNPEQTQVLKSRLMTLCREMRKHISKSQQAARTQTGKQTITRLCKEFFIQHKKSCVVYDMTLLLERIQHEIELLGVDGEKLATSIKSMIAQLTKIRNSGQGLLKDEEWENWSGEIRRLEKNPVDFVTSVVADGTFDTSVVESQENDVMGLPSKEQREVTTPAIAKESPTSDSAS